MSNPKPHKVLVYAVCETVVSNDDPVEVEAICRKLFEDDISSKSEMFSVRVERVEVQETVISDFNPDDDPDLIENIDRFNRI